MSFARRDVHTPAHFLRYLCRSGNHQHAERCSRQVQSVADTHSGNQLLAQFEKPQADRDASPHDGAYRAISGAGQVAQQSTLSSPAVHIEINRRNAPQPVLEWLYRQPVATMMCLRGGFTDYHLSVAGAAERSYSPRRDRLFYLPPGADAQGHFVVDKMCSYVAVFLPAELAENAASHPLMGFDDPAIRHGLLDLPNWKDDPGFSIMAEGWTLQTAARLRIRSLEVVRPPDTVPELNHGRLIEFLRYGRSAPTLAGMADVAGMSRNELMQSVWNRTKLTPFEYAVKMRMEAAAALLADSHYSISQVAARFGYKSPEAFARAFRRVIHLSPEQYCASLS